MKIVDINGKMIRETSRSKLQVFLYNTLLGRFFLRMMITKPISYLMGVFMNSFLSKVFIKPFIKKKQIDLSNCEKQKFKSYNDFFTRKYVKINYDNEYKAFISPSDSKLAVYEVTNDALYTIKGSQYTLESFLQNKELANEYVGGYLLVYRLEVDDYHRYIYIDDGNVETGKKIKGRYHTVNPIAFEKYNVFKENNREYAVLNTKNFGKIIQMEVGALMVGKIKNHEIKDFSKGDEKGLFLFGGSTVVVLVKKDTVSIDPVFLEHTKNGCETKVYIGQKIGESL